LQAPVAVLPPSLAAPSPIPAQGHGRRLNDRLPAILDHVAAVIRDGVDTGKHTNGARVAALEDRMARWLGTPDVVGVASGSAALRCAFELMELPPGSEVIVPAYTFIMTAYPVSDAFAVDPGSGVVAKGGLVPVFVDVDPHTYTIDPEQARAAITDRTRAILAVHMSGQMADMGPLLELADAHDLIVVEDAAQAHGAAYGDPASGTMWKAGSAGHFGCFSLSDVKNIGTLGADAGALVISQRAIDRFGDVAARARAWRDTGRAGGHRYHHQAWGVRARMDEYSAAECAAELELLDGWNARRRSIARPTPRRWPGAPWRRRTSRPGACTRSSTSWPGRVTSRRATRCSRGWRRTRSRPRTATRSCPTSRCTATGDCRAAARGRSRSRASSRRCSCRFPAIRS
jgi:dTDP-4-amino-4,6-dideoxygalactose transaminase